MINQRTAHSPFSASRATGKQLSHEVAPSITSLLHRIVSGPLPWLGTWRHLDEYGEQYYVMSVEFLDGMPDHSDTTDIRVVDTGISSGVADEPLVRLGGPDNNSWLYRGAAHYPGCTRIMDPASHDPGFRLVRRGADYSSTYDGGVIVSNDSSPPHSRSPAQPSQVSRRNPDSSQ